MSSTPEDVCSECGEQFSSLKGVRIHKTAVHDVQTEVECENCGEKFEKLPKNIRNHPTHYCSRDCYREGVNNTKTVTCKHCGREHEKARRFLNETGTYYCSNDCRDTHKSRQVEVSCDYCGSGFKRQKSMVKGVQNTFCDIDCRSKWQWQSSEITFMLEPRPRWTVHSRKIHTHRLVAIANGADPQKVFSDREYNIHHKNGCKIDNRPENLEILHCSEHLEKERAKKESLGYSHKDVLSVVAFMMNPGEFL